jgi:hypothetical protein
MHKQVYERLVQFQASAEEYGRIANAAAQWAGCCIQKAAIIDHAASYRSLSGALLPLLAWSSCLSGLQARACPAAFLL